MAFVHLHNHSDFSILDASTRIADLVKTAVDDQMPAVALTDRGYLFGIPTFDLECRKYNSQTPAAKQHLHNIDCFKNNELPEEPPADNPAEPAYAHAHAQWEADLASWQQTGSLDAVKQNKPPVRIRPIFGCEGYFIKDDCIERGAKQLRFHLILLAKNATGYANLLKCMSIAAGHTMMYYKPRITWEMLKTYHEGLICLSACAQGIIPWHIRNGNFDEAQQWALQFKELFGDDFYIEIEDHGLQPADWNGFSDRTLSEQLVKLAARCDIKVVATNDVHYLTRDDAQVQDILSCIGSGAHLDDTNRKKLEGSEFYFKSEAEMRELFDWCPEAIENTLEVAQKCDFELDWSHIYLPQYPGLREGESAEERFREECEKGLAKRYGADWRTRVINGINVQERFEYEYKIICDKGFANYFLIVQDYVQWAKDNGIGVGPGRGSAAGAIVAYAMNITTFDPLENGLMFERFLSPQRSEMPDIDMDFEDEHLQDVLAHVRKVYGEDHVCKVITYSTIKAKQAINDATRVLGQPVFMGQRLSKMLSADPKLQLEYALHRNDKHPEQYSPDFEKVYKEDETSRAIIDAALSIEGLTRGEGVHACATLITPTPVTDHVPTKVDTKGNVTITQYEGHSVADMGLLKMDFLGLRTLTVINKALRNIEAAYPNPQDIDRMPAGVKKALKPGATSVAIDVDAIDFSDPKIYELLGSGHTAGVFQVESAGMTATIKNMQPKKYSQIVALIALYRPGPLGAGMVTSYINRMNGREPIVFYDDRLGDILNETYGTIVYQEQVMQISVKMSNFSAGESDSRIRKPVAKKKIKLLTSTRFRWDNGKEETTYEHWMNGAIENGYKKETAQKIWEDVLEFASYAFNKSHSAGYAILVMQTAWIKAYFPKEYMASVLSSHVGKTDKIVHYVNACRREGIQVLPPDINESGREFTAVEGGIRFGFAGIRGVGEGAADCIIAERAQGGPFKNIHDFVDRVDASQANRRVIEALVKAGAYDSTGYTRMQCMSFIDKNNPENIVDAAVRHQKERATGQISMFDMFSNMDGFKSEVPAPTGIEWDRLMKLALEKDVLGIYVSDHPLTPYEYALAKARTCTLDALEESTDEVDPISGATVTQYQIADGATIWIAGMVSSVQRKATKKGDPMAVVTVEDMGGEVSVVVFPKLYKKSGAALAPRVDPVTGQTSGEAFVRIKGKLERSDRGMQLIAQEFEALDLQGDANKPQVIELVLSSDVFSRAFMERLNATLANYEGMDRVEMRMELASGDMMRIELPTLVDANNVVLQAELNDLLYGYGKVVIG